MRIPHVIDNEEHRLADVLNQILAEQGPGSGARRGHPRAPSFGPSPSSSARGSERGSPRPTLAAGKCVFNLVPCDNEFEKEFARFLERAEDVLRFAKLPDQFDFSIDYTDGKANLRYYEPDFVALTKDGTHYILETKGLEDVNVVNKDRAAILWCENTTRLTANASGPIDHGQILTPRR